MAISTNGTVLARVAGALYNTQMSNATYSEVKTLDPAALVNALYARDFSSATDASVATTLVTNLGLTSITGLVNWVAGQLTAAGTGNKGAKIVDLLNGFAQMTSDATYGAYATAFNAKVDAALVLSQTTGNAGGTFTDVGAPAPVVGAVFTLTSSTDTFNGGAGNDTINGNQLTFAAGDMLTGGEGTDTLSITNTSLTGTNYSVAPAVMSGIENVQISSLSSGTGAIDLAGATGVSKVISKNSVVNDSFTAIQSQAAVEIDGGSSRVVKATFLDSLAGATKTASVTLKGGVTVSELDIAGVGATEYGIISVSSEGTTANTLTLIEDEASNSLAALKTLNVSGSADLTLGTASAAVAAAGDTINAATATGKLTVNGTNFETITLGSGNDTLYLASSQVSAASATTDQVTLNGGSGSNTLVFGAQDLTSSGLANTAATTDNDTISNFQTVRFTAVLADGGTADLLRSIDATATGITEVTTVVVDAENGDATAGGANGEDVTVAVSGLIAGQKVQASFKASSTSTNDEIVTLAMASPTGTDDAVTFESVAGANTAVNQIETLTVSQTTVSSVAQSVETLNVIASRADVSSTVGTTINAVDAGYTAALSVSGAKNITIAAAELYDSSTADTTYATIDASTLTGNLILGGSSADFQSTDADDIRVTLGSGTNKVYGLAALDDGDYVTGTTGTDTVYLTAGSGAVNLSNIDVVAVAGATASSSAANWTNVGAVTITNSTASSTLTNLSSGQVINSDDIDSGKTLTLNNKTGVTSLAVNLNGATASAGTLATNATSVTINAGATSSNYAISDAIILNATPTSVTLTGGGASAAATYAAKFTLSNSSSGLVTSVNSSYDGNLDVSGVYFDTAAAASTVTTGATSASSTTTVGVTALTNGAVHFQDNGGTDVLSFATTGDSLGYINVDGYETIQAVIDSGAALTANLRDSSGYSTIALMETTTSGTSASDLVDNITVSSIASGTTVRVGGYYGNGSDTLTLNAASGTADTLTLTSAASRAFISDNTSAAVTTTGFETVNIVGGGVTGTARAVDLATASITTTLTGATTVNLGSASTTQVGAVSLGTLDATSMTSLNMDTTGGAVAVASLGTPSALTTIGVTTVASNKATISAGTAAALTGVTASGAGDFEITALTASALTSINASGVTGAVTLGTSSVALTLAAGATVTGGNSADTVTIAATNLLNLALGSGTDTVYVVGAQNGGAGFIDLSSSTDQIVSFNGVAQSTTQTGINNINLAGVTSANSYGFSVTAAATGSTITGSAYADTIILGAASDVVVMSTATTADTINGFTLSGTGTIDKINVDALTTSSAFDASLTTGTTAITTVSNKIYLVTTSTAGGADSTTGAATAINAAAAWTDTAATLYVVVVDNNSTGIFKWVAAGDGSESAASELTLVGTADAALVAGNFLFA